jgi:hypothetical protein
MPKSEMTNSTLDLNQSECVAYRLQITPIPQPLFGVNLRAVLRPSQWNSLRSSLIAERGKACETCRTKVHYTSDLHAHEEWEYDVTSDPACAHIRRIVLQCRKCHGCEHFFRLVVQARKAMVAGWQITDVIEHFCAVNGATREEFDQHAQAAMTNWRRLSSLRWRVNLRPYSDLVIDVEPPAEIGAVDDDEMQWDDPADGRRRQEFMELLTAISTKYGYWIGNTTLHVRPRNTMTGGYSISRIIALDTPDGATAPHRLEWSGEPKKRKLGKPKVGRD